MLTGANAGEPEVPKEGVNLGLSGALTGLFLSEDNAWWILNILITEDTNTFNGVVIKYSEPPEARLSRYINLLLEMTSE